MDIKEYLRASDGTGNAVLANIQANRDIGSTTILVDSVAKWPEKFIVTTGTVDANDYIDPATITEFTAHAESGNVIIDAVEPGYTDEGNTIGQVAIIKQTTGWANRVSDIVNDLSDDLGPTKTTVDALGTVWAAWSPTLTGLTIGNGSVIAAYKEVGKTVFFRIRITFGSTSNFTGVLEFTLPKPMIAELSNSTNEGYILGNAKFLNAAIVANYGFVQASFNNVNRALFTVMATSGSFAAQNTVINGTPFGFGPNDMIMAEGFYEQA